MSEDKTGSHGHEGRKATFEKTAGEPTRGLCRDKHEVLIDEPEWIPRMGGEDAHPSPVDYMMTALAACQVSVLSQCLSKARIDDYNIKAEATIDDAGEDDVDENMPDHTANRIRHIDIQLHLEVPAEHEKRASRCLEVYDTGCIVGQSYKAGIDYEPTTHLSTK
ncbi:OsmC family protein [Halorubrum sp. DTA98]|uniref:OsmC family protein n=1 Tax=Halorubrum sp. DTA98 TaxID=3402163 RepID=UPI003AB0B7FE